MNFNNSFDSALYGIPEDIRRKLLFLPDSLKNKVEEIRLRVGLPLTLTVCGKPIFLNKNGGVSEFINKDMIIPDKSEVEEAFRLICRNSVYAHEKEIKKGFVMMRSGHRAGICGRMVEEGIKDISSINIRIAREVLGVADSLVSAFDGGGVLIAGPPGSGKTTLLRDFIRQLSNGEAGFYMRVAVIDTRGELSGSFGGECVNNLGANTDVILCEDKANGSLMALRTMYPDIIAFDEIGTALELKSVAESFNAGVSIITTAHIGNVSDLYRRSVTKALLKSGAISLIAVLPEKIGEKFKIYSLEELESDYTL